LSQPTSPRGAGLDAIPLPAVRLVREYAGEDGLWRIYADDRDQETAVHARGPGSCEAASVVETAYRAQLSFVGML